MSPLIRISEGKKDVNLTKDLAMFLCATELVFQISFICFVKLIINAFFFNSICPTTEL